jgi:subtilisin family serine protease
MVGHHAAGVPAVANLSLGGSASVALNNAVARAVADGITVVVAAGNSAADACNVSPASAPSAITVSATDRYDFRAGYSNFGSCVDIFAPGSGVLSAGIDSPSDEATLSGTSMASPHVAGAAALILDTAPASSPAEVAQILAASATSNVVTNRGAGSPNLLLHIGPVVASQPSTSTTAPAAQLPPSSSTSTVIVSTTTTAAPQVPVTTVVSTTTTAAPQAPTTAVDTTTTLAPTTTSIAPQVVNVRSAAIDSSGVDQPEAKIVRASADKVLVRITKARGPVDVLVNGKRVMTTKKRVLLLKAKGIGAKRVTVAPRRSNSPRMIGS